jgi:hypothetical protein
MAPPTGGAIRVLGRPEGSAARSAATGKRVVVTVPHFQRDIGRYFTGLLRRLGYRASLRVLPDDGYFPEIIQTPGDARADRVQRVVLGLR